MTQQKVKSLHEGCDIGRSQVASSYAGVRCFFETAVRYSVKTYIPLGDALLENASIVNVKENTC